MTALKESVELVEAAEELASQGYQPAQIIQTLLAIYSEEPPDGDTVNHPAHYTAHPSGVECIQITRHRNFNVGNAIKYLWRNGLKTSSADPLDKQIEDLARQEMISNPGTDDPAQRTVMVAAARDATISKKGMCNTSKPDTYACMVDVTVKLPNAPETKQAMVVQIGKGADGGWKVIE